MSTSPTDTPLQRTELYDSHVAAGARIVPFAGWEMPVQYSGIRDEVKAVREACGIFDVSHMGQLWISGRGATEKLNRAVTNDWSTLEVGRVGYALLLNEVGGVIDDVMGYRLDEDNWLVVVNASRAGEDEAALRSRLSGLGIANGYDNQAMIAIQGPNAAEIFDTLEADTSSDEFAWRDCMPVEFKECNAIVARGGYTGADGFEIMCDAETGVLLWEKLIEAGALPCGLGARDVLRLEAGLPLYGHELREEWTPFESSSGFAVKMDKESFYGQAALIGKEKPARSIKALKMLGNAIPREGYDVQQGGEYLGEITSGTLSPTLGYGIALALLPASVQVGENVEVKIREKVHPAKIVKKPFVAFDKK